MEKIPKNEQASAQNTDHHAREVHTKKETKRLSVEEAMRRSLKKNAHALEYLKDK